MLNKEKHKLIMGRILKDIYTDTTISSLLGFKGGTCAFFFYGLPRFSVDLDFDLLEVTAENQEKVFDKIVDILNQYGQVKDKCKKRFTIFALLSYGEDDHNIKVEINIRKLAQNIRDHYIVKEHLSIPMLVAKEDYLFASKLSALTLRPKPVMRDIFDIHYFAKNNWDINVEIIKERVGKKIKDYLIDCVAFVEKIENSQILQGLGELVENEKEKMWIRNHLKADTVFMLKNYLSVME